MATNLQVPNFSARSNSLVLSLTLGGSDNSIFPEAKEKPPSDAPA
jgi:hypothetical protein